MKDDTEVDYVPSRLMYTSKAQILYSSLVFGADQDKKYQIGNRIMGRISIKTKFTVG